MTHEQFSEQYTNNFERTVAFLAKRGFSEPDEMAQYAWARAWEKRAQFQGRSQFRNWVIMIALHHIYSLHRSEERHGRHVPLEFAYNVSRTDPTEQRTMINQTFRRMKRKDVNYIVRHLIEGESLRCSETSTVRVRVNRARHKFMEIAA